MTRGYDSSCQKSGFPGKEVSLKIYISHKFLLIFQEMIINLTKGFSWDLMQIKFLLKNKKCRVLCSNKPFVGFDPAYSTICLYKAKTKDSHISKIYIWTAHASFQKHKWAFFIGPKFHFLAEFFIQSFVCCLFCSSFSIKTVIWRFLIGH